VSPLAELWRGATRPSPTALVTALGVLAGAFFGLLSPRVLVGEGYVRFMDGARDDYPYLTGRVLELAGGVSAPPAAVVVLGGSSLGAALASEAALGAAVADASGVPCRAYDLCAGSLTTWEMAAAADRVGAATDAVFVLGLTLSTLSDGPRRSAMGRRSLEQLVRAPRLGFASRAFDEEARRAGLEPPPRTGLYAVDNLAFFVARRAAVERSFLEGPVAHDRDRYLGRRPVGEDYWNDAGDAYRILGAHHAEHAEAQLGVVARLVERARSTGDAVALVLPPVSPRLRRRAATVARLDAHRERVRRFAAEHGHALVDLERGCGLLESDFLDAGHLRLASARERTTRALAEGLAEVVAAWRAAAPPRAEGGGR